MDRHTYKTHTKSELGYTDDEWEGLEAYLTSIQSALKESQKERPQREHIEEDPPEITKKGFWPGGWVGKYPGGQTIVPGRLDEAEFDRMLTDIQEWVEIFGADTISTTFPLSAEILLDERTRLAGYSRILIEYTENILAHRLPVSVERTKQRVHSPQGRPIIPDTITERAQGSQQVVTENVEFSFESLPNYLLLKFHIEIASQMRELADDFGYYEQAFRNQIQYHQQFLDEEIPSRLVDQALDVDFADPRILSKVRREVSGEMADVVDLWESFQRNIGIEIQLAENLTTAIKPMSKTYELWCLSVIDEILSEVVGDSGRKMESLAGVFQYGSSVKLYYNRSVGKHSNYLHSGMGIYPGKPDFAVVYEGELVWVGDAKYKTWKTLKLEDYQRFITYLVDLLPPDSIGSILYVGGGTDPINRNRPVGDFNIEHLALRPTNREECIDRLRDSFSSSLNRHCQG